MRSSGNFSPEWGYLAPAPSFARTARVVLVATAIGATAGAGVVLSLLDRSGEPEKTSTGGRAIVTSVRTAAVPSVAAVAPAPTAAPAVTAKSSSPPSVATAAPSVQPNNSARTSSRATPQSRAAVPAVATSPAPAPAAPSAAAAASANAS